MFDGWAELPHQIVHVNTKPVHLRMVHKWFTHTHTHTHTHTRTHTHGHMSTSLRSHLTPFTAPQRSTPMQMELARQVLAMEHTHLKQKTTKKNPAQTCDLLKTNTEMTMFSTSTHVLYLRDIAREYLFNHCLGILQMTWGSLHVCVRQFVRACVRVCLCVCVYVCVCVCVSVG